MEFSNSTAPVSRETWAPRSPSPPPRSGGDYSERAPPSGPRGGDDAPRAPSNGGDYERDRDGRDSRRDNGYVLFDLSSLFLLLPSRQYAKKESLGIQRKEWIERDVRTAKSWSKQSFVRLPKWRRIRIF
ncbi:uncharacterized protein I206_104230 [Kwoniella pini CBS 10737]|uniref:Uncharacterized protein n=1 Tax=Kwoniella pini CBS 10737 TaxID=1296096 RepID=A0A1B9I290_9TREE|nr:uncharacterized protein I206_04192 [Kwoniella pini CBS 10737]OCF49670.1 hypothetical protein I206_04192 [Kwoniella pini CBS 10737]